MIAPKKEGGTCGCFIESLIDRAKQGDSKARDELFAWLRPRIRAVLVRLTRRNRAAIADVEDATQAACLGALLGLTRWPWQDLLRQSVLIGRHKLARMRTARNGRGKTLFFSELSLDIIESLTTTVAKSELDPARLVQECEEAARASAALQELARGDRRITWTVLVEGQSIRQCSRSLGISKTAVQRGLTDGKAYIARRLKENT